MNVDDLSPRQKRALLARLLRQRAASPGLNLSADCHVDLELADEVVDASAEPRNVLLTGATGFVGAFVLRRLLDFGRARVHCLVRAADDDEARRRIRENLLSYGLSVDGLAERVVPIPGDLTGDDLGVGKQRLRSLAGEIDAIHHLAALVNLAYDYSQLKASNVEGTRQIVRFAAAVRRKPLHYLSSYAVFDSVHNVGRTFSEEDDPLECDRLSNGYAETKWVAERMVRNARAAGIPTAIYRVGWVIGDSRSGAWNNSDFLPRVVRAFVRAGKFCDFGTFTMTPVDFVASAFVHLAADRSSLGRVFHLSSGQRYGSRQLFAWIKACGYDLQEVALEDWEREVRGSSDELSLLPLFRFLHDVAGGHEKLSRWLSHEPDVDVTATREHLAARGIACPQIDQQLIAIYLSRFAGDGEIPHAPSHA